MAFCSCSSPAAYCTAPVTVLVALQFIADGVFFAELNELLTRELAEDGYSGVEVRVTPMRTEIIIRATRTQNVLGEHSICSSSWQQQTYQQTGWLTQQLIWQVTGGGGWYRGGGATKQQQPFRQAAAQPTLPC
jgi:hypothetical protein